MSTQTLSCLVPVKMLKAALLFARNDPLRKYGNGVCVQGGAHGVRLISTDGHRLFVGKVNEDVVLPLVKFTIATETLESAFKTLTKREDALVVTWSQETTDDPTRPGVKVVSKAAVTVGPLHVQDMQDSAGKFPDWAQVVPRSVSGKPAQYNAAYLHDCGKAHAILEGKSPTKAENLQFNIFHNGEKPGYAPLSPDAFVVVMPMHYPKKDQVFTLPSWFVGKVNQVATQDKQAA